MIYVHFIAFMAAVFIYGLAVIETKEANAAWDDTLAMLKETLEREQNIERLLERWWEVEQQRVQGTPKY